MQMKRSILQQITPQQNAIATLILWLSFHLAYNPNVAHSVEPPTNAISVAPQPSEIFESRIMPIFRFSKPSSCIQCHLASVDLKDDILASHQETFVALERAGLIDRKDPSQSKILNLIRMGEKDSNPSAKRLPQKTRQAELEVFGHWIVTTCNQDTTVASDTSRKSEAEQDSYPADDDSFNQQESNAETNLIAGEDKIRVFIDRQGKLDGDPAIYLDEENFLGEMTLTSQWNLGFPNATIFSATDLKR